jgi:hypothetical protein
VCAEAYGPQVQVHVQYRRRQYIFRPFEDGAGLVILVGLLLGLCT